MIKRKEPSLTNTLQPMVWPARLITLITMSVMPSVLMSVHRSTRRWSLRAAMAAVAEAGSGVVLLLGHPLDGDVLLAHIRETAEHVPAKKPTTYSIVGAGSQILRDLGVRKMRLMSAPMKFNAISGFDLEVVEYVPSE